MKVEMIEFKQSRKCCFIISTLKANYQRREVLNTIFGINLRVVIRCHFRALSLELIKRFINFVGAQQNDGNPSKVH